MSARPQFDAAWDFLLPHVKAASLDPSMDDPSIVVVLLRFAAQLHIANCAESALDLEVMQDLFATLAVNCFAQTVEDAKRSSKGPA